MEKCILSLQQLIYKWLCRQQSLENYFHNLSLKLKFSFSMFLNQKGDHAMTFKNAPEFGKEMAKVIYRFEKTKSFLF